MMDSSIRTIFRVRANSSPKRAFNTKESGIEESPMAEELKHGRTGSNTRESTFRGRRRDREGISGQTDPTMRDSGLIT